MRDKRINVLVYSGTGASPSAVQHALFSLRQHLSPNYAVLPLTTETLLNEPWYTTCALLVFPGGGDLGYCRSLNGAGNRLVRRYVHNGGRYLGLCAGGYYGSSKCEFEVGNRPLEVTGERELGFFDGICRGSVFKGFEYGSDRGTKAAKLRLKKKRLSATNDLHDETRIYANGGGYFVHAARKVGIEVLATYDDELNVKVEDDEPAAIVYSKIGDGAAILAGPHPEFAIANISSSARNLSESVYEDLKAHDIGRDALFRSLLTKLGLTVGGTVQKPPELAPLHFTSPDSGAFDAVLKKLEDAAIVIDGEDYVKGEADTFLIKSPEGPWSMSSLTRAALDVLSSATEKVTNTATSAAKSRNDQGQNNIDGHASPPDHANVIKSIVFHNSLPSLKQTPHFDHHLYFHTLPVSQTSASVTFGTPLITTDCTTSTSTLLSANPTLISALPDGTTFTAKTQLSGRGRGSNIWVSPEGALMFTTVFKHLLELNLKAPVVFVQYLAAMAVIDAVRTFSTTTSKASYSDMPVRLKWPNDIYALDSKNVGRQLPEGQESWRDQYTKIGGILVNTSYSGSDFTVILGIGLNLSNAAPTTSLNTLISALNEGRFGQHRLEAMSQERLLARIMTCFSGLYETFKTKGFAGELERKYTSMWLHNEQIVTLETEGGARARIKGVSSDWGLLVAEEAGEQGRLDGAGGHGRKFALQSDSNSFDFFKGLLKRKL